MSEQVLTALRNNKYSAWIHTLKEAHCNTRNLLIVLLIHTHIIYKVLVTMERKTMDYDYIMCSAD